MEQVLLGNSGLSVSKVIIGMMSFGSSGWQGFVDDDEQKAFDVLNKAYELGMRTFDTANVYSNGKNEEIIGKWLKKYNINRDKVVILSKCFFIQDPMLDGVKMHEIKTKFPEFEFSNQFGLSRKNIIASVKKSVERLGTYIDVLQIHRFDPSSPKKEIMKALHDCVELGLCNYIGASAMRATEFAALQFTAEKYGYTKFISMQSYYNLLYREDEREMNEFCYSSDFGPVGLIPYSPLAAGLLTRPLGTKGGTNREEHSAMINKHYLRGELTKADVEIINRVEKLADKYSVSMASVAIVWLWSRKAWPIVGVTSVERVESYMQALKLTLSDEDLAYLEEPYEAKPMILSFNQTKK